MTAISMSVVSLLAGAAAPPSQSALLSPLAGTNPSFLQTLENMSAATLMQVDAEVPVQATVSALNTEPFILEVAELPVSKQKDGAENENLLGLMLDPASLAAWIPNFALMPATTPVTETVVPVATAITTTKVADPVVDAEIPLAPVLQPSSEVSTLSLNSPSNECSDKPLNTSQSTLPNTLQSSPQSTPSSIPSSTTVIFSTPPASVNQAVPPSTPTGSIILDKRSQKNSPIDSQTFSSTEVFLKTSIDSSVSVQSGQFNGLTKPIKFENDLLLLAAPETAQISHVPSSRSEFSQLALRTEAIPQIQSQETKWTSNLADTVNQWVEKSLQLAELTVPAAGQDILQVRIEINGQDAKVYFLTDHAQYREALDSQIENLSDRLADQGLKLTGSFVGQGGAQNSPQKQTTHNILAQRFESEAAPAKLLSIESEQRPSKSVHLGRYLDVFA
jgi:flagellar hook-length control protein FliK